MHNPFNMHSTSNVFKELQRSGMMLPLEEMLEIERRNISLTIGIPKETSFQENRVALVPEAIALLTNYGHQVVVESDAGKNANFQDKDFSEAGAQIVYSREAVYESNLIIKVSPPTIEEIELVKPKQVIFSAIQMSTNYGAQLKKLSEKKATAFGFNYITDEEGVFPVVRSMGEIAGSTSILIAAEYLSNVNSGKGIMPGGITGIPPTEIVIIGAGIVGENAARVALGLGATVKVFDNSLSRLARIRNMFGGHQLYTSLIRQDELAKQLASADVVIGALRAPEGRTPCVVTESMVSDMKYGAVIIDVSIDQGGCFETSIPTNHENPVYKKYGVTHYCVPNIPSRVAHTASIALSNVLGPIVLEMGECGGVEKYLANHRHIRSGLYLYNGFCTNKFFAKMYSLTYKDIDLLMAAF